MADRTSTIWETLSQKARTKMIRWIWLVTWGLLLFGLFDRIFYEFVVTFSLLHAVLFLTLFRFQLLPLPVQVRIAYVLWVVIGTYVPGMIILMYITTIGLATNLFLGYCPMARMITLLPWNREGALSSALVKKTFLSPPVKGEFKL